jgi:hypothetical protein
VQVNLTDALASRVQAIPETLRVEFTDILVHIRRTATSRAASRLGAGSLWVSYSSP